jgi:putative peptide zinc metalloprotease protein
LADGTELISEYRGSGFTEPKYLIQRVDGQVMQLSALLYRLAAALDGRRSLAQIADELSMALARDLSADQLAYLIENRLRPLV